MLVLFVVGLVLCAAAVVAKETNTNGNDEEEEEFVCNVYVAPSTIPGTGLGMYAGRKGYKQGEVITKTMGDHIVTIPDFKEQQSDTGLYDQGSDDQTKYFLWDQYTWNQAALGIHFEDATSYQNEIASPGFGAAANSFMDFVNVEEGGPQQGLLPPRDGNTAPNNKNNNNFYNYYYNVHRSKDPGAGAFTEFHSRQAWAKQDIAPNAEFFVSYGNEWFTDRVYRLGTIPVQGDHEEAEWLWKIFNKEFLGNANVFFGKQTQPQHDNDDNDEDEDQDNDDDDDEEDQERIFLEELEIAKRNYNDEDKEFQNKVRRSIRKTNPTVPVDDELKKIHREFWTDVVATFAKSVWDESRIMASLPNDKFSDEYETMLTTKGGYKEVKKQKMVRSQEWLEKHGTCADSVRIGRSSLPNQQAGHGAFARTTFLEEEVIMAAPLIHIPDKAVLNTFYRYDNDDDDNNNDEEKKKEPNIEEMDDLKTYNKKYMQHFALPIHDYKTGDQLLLNYVFGHRDSTMLLSPYGPGVQLINHNQTLANVKLQWAEPERSNHHPELLEKSIQYINDEFPLGSVLGMEIVATKPIARGEELFLDYGDEWEEAWQKHVQHWKPQPGSETYVSAADLNLRPEHANKPLPNCEYDPEAKTNLNTNNCPFPKTVRLLLNMAWTKDNIREIHGDDYITEDIMYNKYDYIPVETLIKTGTVDDNNNNNNESLPDNTLYTVVARVDAEYDEETREQAREEGRSLPPYETLTVHDIPRRGLKFEDRGYTTDQFLEHAFREYIRIPDEIFPEAWKNLPTDNDKEEHYWKYRFNPNDPDRTPWFDLLEEEEQEETIEEVELGDDNENENDNLGDEEEEKESTTLSMHDLLDEEGLGEDSPPLEEENDDDDYDEEDLEEYD